MKNKGFGHLKIRLFTIKTSKNVGFGVPWFKEVKEFLGGLGAFKWPFILTALKKKIDHPSKERILFQLSFRAELTNFGGVEIMKANTFANATTWGHYQLQMEL